MMQHLTASPYGHTERDALTKRVNWALLSGVSPTEGQGGSFALVPVTPPSATTSQRGKASGFLSTISGLTPTQRRARVMPPPAGQDDLSHTLKNPKSSLRASSLPPSPPPSPPTSEQSGPSGKRTRQTEYFKEAMALAAIKEVNEEVQTTRRLKRVAKLLFVAGLLNVFTPQGWFGIATSVLLHSVKDVGQAVRRDARGRQMSLTQLQGTQEALNRAKRRFGLARTFCLLADVLAILGMGLMAIVGVVSIGAENTGFPRELSIVLLIASAAQLVLTVALTSTFVLADKVLFMTELKLADIKLANAAREQAGKFDKEGSESGSRSSKSSRSSRSSRSSIRVRDASRQYWSSLQSKCIDNCFAILFLFYPSCSAITFQVGAPALDST